MGFKDFFPTLKQIQGKQPVSVVAKPELKDLGLMPETIDFSALWDEPSDGGGLQQILVFANTGLLVVILVMSFF